MSVSAKCDIHFYTQFGYEFLNIMELGSDLRCLQAVKSLGYSHLQNFYYK